MLFKLFNCEIGIQLGRPKVLNSGDSRQLSVVSLVLRLSSHLKSNALYKLYSLKRFQFSWTQSSQVNSWTFVQNVSLKRKGKKNCEGSQKLRRHCETTPHLN